jgi:ribose transport system ATP-binding protein
LQLIAQNISKSFGATSSLVDVSIILETGQVRALVGENGAGKSTLFKVCAGAIQSDSGSMTLNGKPYDPQDMRAAQLAGVALVFQEVTINPSLDIAENIYIDRLRDFVGPSGISNWKSLRKAAQIILDDMGANFSVDQDINKLNLGQWKVVEIARALSYNPKILLLDESTAFLNSQEKNALFSVINNLKKQGIAIGFVSHHLDEIDEIADTITVLKDGEWVGDYASGALSTEAIEALMVGREIGRNIYPETRAFINSNGNILEIKKLTVSGQLDGIDLELYAGEILGIGGLKGSGGEAILGAIIGDIPFTRGEMLYENKPYHPRQPYDAWDVGIAYLPGDRTGEGLILDYTVSDNLSMASIPRKGIFLDKPAVMRLSDKYISILNIKAESSNTPCNSLSGGNLQKVALGKCMAPRPKILLLNNPTRGIDVGARMEIYQIIRKLANDGVSIIFLTEDLLELIGLSDRIIITRMGKISKAFKHEEFPSEEEIIRHMI